MATDLTRQCQESVEKTFRFIERTGIATYDPNDVQGAPLFVGATSGKGILSGVCRKVLRTLDTRYPLAIRRIAGIKPRIVPGGMAFYSSALLDRGGPGDLKTARELLGWLDSNKVTKHGGESWGFPFHWPSIVLVPPNTGIGHTTMCCGNAFWKYYEATQDAWALDRCKAACEFLATGLNQTTRASGAIALSYTPLDHSQVINTNADIASLLLRVGRELGRADFQQLGRAIVSFVLETQNADGSWNYNAPDVDGGRSKIDNYHTGMNLCALMDIMPGWEEESPPLKKIEETFRKGLSFFIGDLFEETGEPRFTTKALYPLDIYSFAQSIITLNRASGFAWAGAALREKASERCSQTVTKCLQLMARKDGGFLFRKFARRDVNINSLRWANALTCSALLQFIQRHP